MRSVILSVIFYFGTSTLSEQINGPAFEIDKFLDYVIARESSVKNADVFKKIPYQSELLTKPDDNAENSLNLMDIQSPKHRYKNNNARDEKQFQNDLELALREESDKICRETGRCGCDGGRCGSQLNPDDSTVNDVERLLKVIENNLNRDDQLGKDDILDYDNNDLHKDDEDSDLKRMANEFQKDNNLKIIFLEESDLDDKKVINRLHNLADDVKIVDLRNANLESILHRLEPLHIANKNTLRSSDIVTPEDFNKYYEKGKLVILNELADFVKGEKNSTYIAQLSPSQRTLLNIMKKKHTKVQKRDDKIKRDITNIVFGTHSSIRILPQSQDFNVHVPRHLYEAIKKFKEHNNLRVKKSILPLTLQQKIRMKDKMSSKILPKLNRRRNMQPRNTYGVPFDLDIQGLGQFNN